MNFNFVGAVIWLSIGLINIPTCMNGGHPDWIVFYCAVIVACLSYLK